MNKIIFIVGLTAVGKTTSIAALKNNNYKLLPNRRELTDLIIIPEILRDMGQELSEIKDRVERFELTAKYRQKHSGGIVYALSTYLESKKSDNYFFDNIRGVNELAAASKFTNSYFIFLDAPNLVRLQRLIDRNDSFDQTSSVQNNNLLAELNDIKNASAIFNLKKIAKLAHNAREANKIISAVKIIVSENANYDSKKTKKYLENLDNKRFIYTDTSKLGILEVKEKIERFIDGINN